MIARSLAVLAALGTALSAQGHPFHFTYDVQPWLARQGCAAADCHGGATGRGGFKLSLFGGDPRADWSAISVERHGRRLDLRSPERSLVLRKPTTDLDHGGGPRLVRGGAAWRALRDWIDAGAPFGAPAPARIDSFSLALDRDRVRAVASFVWTDPDSGELRRAEQDVTARAGFATSAPDVVDVEPSGRVVRNGPGEAWLFARFAGRDARLRIAIPFAEPGPAHGTTNAIDRAWLEGLRELGLTPADPAPADTLVRRLHVDLAGRLPTPAERRTFHELPERTRVATTVDALLRSDDFAAVAGAWLARWFELPDPGAAATRNDRMLAITAPLRAELATIAAGDASLLGAIADRVERPLIERLPDPRDRAELFGRAVLGVRIGCARCHDHPLDRWTRTDHLSFSAMFVEPRPAADGGMTAGMLFDPQTGDAAMPRLLPLLGTDGAVDVASALRAAPAAFATNIANRVITELLGRGLVEPVDDHRPTNPGVHGALLDALALTFVESEHRLRPLVRAVATSAIYSRTSAPQDDVLNGTRGRYFARRTARPLPESTLRAVIAQALAVETDATGARAASPLSMWLSLWNGADLQSALEAETNAIDVLALFAADDDERLTSMFQLLLTRDPTTAERDSLRPALAAHRDARDGMRALAHAIILTREFTSIR